MHGRTRARWRPRQQQQWHRQRQGRQPWLAAPASVLQHMRAAQRRGARGRGAGGEHCTLRACIQRLQCGAMAHAGRWFPRHFTWLGLVLVGCALGLDACSMCEAPEFRCNSQDHDHSLHVEAGRSRLRCTAHGHAGMPSVLFTCLDSNCNQAHPPRPQLPDISPAPVHTCMHACTSLAEHTARGVHRRAASNQHSPGPLRAMHARHV